MAYIIIGVILSFIAIFILINSLKYKNNLVKINTNIINDNILLEEKNKDLLKEKENIQFEIDNQINRLNSLYQSTEEAINKQKILAKEALENYCDALDIEYKQKEKEYSVLCNNLIEVYEQKQMKLLQETEKISKELKDIKAVRAAAIAAQIREKEIKEKLSFYCLSIKDNELSDIKILEKVKGQLNNPRILSMLIWQTYWQKPMTALCNNILGTSIVSGIYKITNQQTGECYIGQSTDISTRWKAHAKCGLGIDTPANNKLYKAIQEYGIWNFSWEVLEKCSNTELNKKEYYYINLYQSYEYGYNSNAGINK